MNRNRNSHSMNRFAVASMAISVLIIAAGTPASRAGDALDTETYTSPIDKKAKPNIVKLKDARLKIELNATDGDAGIQVFLDAEPWKWMDIYDPYEKLMFRSTTRGRFAKQGGTELFMESAEPNFTELSLAEFLKRFPEGKYRFRGKGMEGEIFVGSAMLTHNLPDGPELVSPLEGQGLVDPNNAVMMWKPVAPPNGSPIVGYQVLVVLPESNVPAIPKTILDVMMPATATSMMVPPGYLLPGMRYEWEVLAIEASGNQTLSTAFFETAP